MPFKENNPPVFTITDMVQKDYRPLFSRALIPMWVAQVEHAAGHNFTFSHREDDEEGAWYADMLILPNGMPSFVHGEGERTTAKSRATDMLEKVLNARMAQ